MKLRNKKTGEIVNADFNAIISGRTNIIIIQNGPEQLEYNSLAELNEEWEDYEEPKEYWYIEPDGSIIQNHKPTYINHLLDGLKSIGNYFETKEEAEKAVEKLKAWKRLKDKGFKFEGIAGITNEIYFKANEQFTHIMVDEYTADETEKEYIDDLMLLFGGEK